MLNELATLTQLTPAQITICVGVVFLAGVVRGFSGFALSALIMAGLVVILPPIQLIPICYLLEGAASVLMFRGGIKEANMKIVWGLAIFSSLGVPIGLYATTTLPIETSKLIALCLIIALAIAQLAKLRMAFLATSTGLYLAGLLAGIVTGLASIGGMVVALYVLSQQAPARQMRASLVMYLFIGMFTSLIYLILYEVMTEIALYRALVLAPAVILGVLLGSWIFRPSLETFYKRFCLLLLVGLASIGLIRMVLS